MRPIRAIILSCVLGAIATAALADNCFRAVRAVNVHHGHAAVVHKAIAPAYAYHLGSVYYATSIKSQVEAHVDKRLRTDTDYQDFLRFQAFREGYRAGREGDTTARPEGASTPLLAQKCSTCHGIHKAAPDGGFYLDPTVVLSAEDREKAESRIRDGSMPPPDTRVKLTDSEVTTILEELFQLRQASKRQEQEAN